MKTRTFQLKEILPNPYRDLITNPLDEKVVDGLIESVQTTGFWEDRSVRINGNGKPELVSGHHMLAALRKVYSGTQEFDWAVVSLNEGGMIQRMARENANRKKMDIQTLFESIRAAVETYGAGKISVGDGVGQIHPVPRTDPKLVRFAPAYSINPTSVAAAEVSKFPYTMQTLAQFLGFIQPNGECTTAFDAAFGALELLKEGYLTESRIRGLEVYKLDEVVSVVKQQRAKALAEAKRLAAEAKARAEEIERKAAALKKQQEQEEAWRKAEAERERQAAIKRAEEKAKREAEEKIRLAAEEKRKKAEAEQRAAAEAKRKEEEEKQRKIREAQRAEAEKQRIEAEKIRQTALAKAKKEADERKAEQMRKDAEAAKARAEAEAKRKEEAARQAEIAAKKREAEEKERQAAAAKKRAEDEARQAAQRKARQEEEARKEVERIEAAKQKAAADKKAADETARKKQEDLDRERAEAKKKDGAAKKDAAAAKAQVRAVGEAVAEKFDDMTRKEIREQKADIVDEAESKAAAQSGRKSASQAHSSSSSVSVDAEKLKRFMDSIRSLPRGGTLGKKSVPKSVVSGARELVSAGRKALALKRHPDAGGSDEEMQALNAATQWLTLLINQNEE